MRYGAGVIDVHREKTKLLGTYWELSSHIPITFTKHENDVNFYISPYALYSNIPYYDDNYKYLFTPSTFMIGLKFGIGIRNN